MDFNREEIRVAIFENRFDFNPDCQQQHRHQKHMIELLAIVFEVKLCSNCADRNEHLLHVVHIERQLIKMTKNIPIRQMSDQTNQLRGAESLNLTTSLRDDLVGEGGHALSQRIISFLFLFNAAHEVLLLQLLGVGLLCRLRAAVVVDWVLDLLGLRYVGDNVSWERFLVLVHILQDVF